MKTHGVLFKGEMMLALLDGRKTQTRRLKGLEEVNEDPDGWKPVFQGMILGRLRVDFVRFITKQREDRVNESVFAPWSPGDTIYAKETFRLINDPATCVGDTALDIDYRADGKVRIMDKIGEGKWKPSIFMPKWASRYRARVTQVRCERLQEITDKDALAEGVVVGPCTKWNNATDASGGRTTPRLEYAKLWDSINGPGSWNQNPWVFAYTFGRIK